MHPNCQTVLFVSFRDQLQRRRLIYMTFVTKRLTFVKLERHARNTLFNKIFPQIFFFVIKPVIRLKVWLSPRLCLAARKKGSPEAALRSEMNPG